MTLAEKITPDHAPPAFPAERLWTREEWDRLVDIGFFADERLELIEGRIVRMSPQRVTHSVAVELVDRYLRSAFSSGHRVRVQLPFRTSDGSEPEPDLAVIAGDDPRASKEHPSSAVLVVEISDTTLEYDRRKAALYAVSAVPEYWILNLISGTLEVHRNIQTSSGVPAYSEVRVLKSGERVSPLNISRDVSVDDLLP
jgi:Uma2 family endonuclease